MEAGIGYKEFFHLTPYAVKTLIEQYWKHRKDEIDQVKTHAWLTGFYVMHAIGANFSRKVKYPKNPLEDEHKFDDTVELTEEQIIAYTKKMFGDFELLKKKFERDKEKSGQG